MIPAGVSVCLDTANAQARTLTVLGTLSNCATPSVLTRLVRWVRVRVLGVSAQAVDARLLIGVNLYVRGDGLVTLDGNWEIIVTVANEAGYVGGGMTPLESDPGMWVQEGGRLDLRGTPKTSWTNLSGGVTAGTTTISVLAASGWQVGDALAIAPTEPATVSGFASHFDERSITALSGNTVTLNAPLSFDHPAVTVRPDVTKTAEVMNLTRTGILRGTDGTHRAHVWINNTRPVRHTLSYITVQYMGPQQCVGEGGVRGPCTPLGQYNLIDNLGRYPIHFHLAGDNNAGTLVDGVVVLDFGMHAEVSHDSNSITWQDTVMYRGYGDAQWWDHQGTQCDTCARPTEPRGLQILHNIAANVAFIPSFRGFILTGFFVGRQDGNMYRDNVAVGIQGNETCSGFHWPEFSHGVAVFDRGNLSHNNACAGLFAWQNDSAPHVIRDFTAYHNRFAGIEHGAYVNLYRYEDVTLYANGNLSGDSANLVLHAMSQPPAPADEGGAPRLQFINVYMDAAGRPWNVMTAAHAVQPAQPVLFIGGTITGHSRAAFNLAATPTISGSFEDWLRVDATVTVTGNRHWLNDNISPDSRTEDLGLRLTLWRRDQAGRCANGSLRVEFNAWGCPN